jgi:hypothetical protein
LHRLRCAGLFPWHPMERWGTTNRSHLSGMSRLCSSHSARSVRNWASSSRRGPPGSAPGTPKSAGNRTVRARGHLALTLALRKECWGQGRRHPKVRQAPSPVPRRVLGTRPFSPGGCSRFCRIARGALGADPIAPATVRRAHSLAPRRALEIEPVLPARAVRALSPAPRRALEIEPFLPRWSSPGRHSGAQMGIDRTDRTLMGGPCSVPRTPAGVSGLTPVPAKVRWGLVGPAQLGTWDVGRCVPKDAGS